MVIPGARPEDGTREVPVPRALRTAPALSTEQARPSRRWRGDLAPRLGYEADLEGAFAADALYLFQARPITTLDANGRARAIGGRGNRLASRRTPGAQGVHVTHTQEGSMVVATKHQTPTFPSDWDEPFDDGEAFHFDPMH